MNLAALIGWACIAIPLAILSNIFVLVYAAIFGLPVSFLCCWVIGAPILKYLMRNEITWGKAASWGGGIALLISLLGTVARLYMNLRETLIPGLTLFVDANTYARQNDGSLSAYDWLTLATPTLIFVTIGVLVASLVWAFIGEPDTGTDDT